MSEKCWQKYFANAVLNAVPYIELFFWHEDKLVVLGYCKFNITFTKVQRTIKLNGTEIICPPILLGIKFYVVNTMARWF